MKKFVLCVVCMLFAAWAKNPVAAQVRNVFELYGGGAQVAKVDTFIFKGYGKGVSNDLPPPVVQAYCQVISGLKERQKAFVQPAADTTRWDRDKYSSADDHRQDASAVYGRGLDGLAQCSDPEIDIVLMPGLTEQSFRGFYLYVVTYGGQSASNLAGLVPRVEKLEGDVAGLGARVSALEQNQGKGLFSDLRLGAGIGFLAAHTPGMDFFTPAVSLVLKKGQAWYVVASLGWREAKASGLKYKDRAELITTAEVRWFPRGGWLGLSAGYFGAYEYALDVDEYIDRVHGFSIGPLARVVGHVHLALPIVFANQSSFGSTNSGEVGLAPNLLFVWVF